MDIGSSFSYVFQDPQWIKKVGIGGGILLLILIPIIIAIALIAFVNNDMVRLVSVLCLIIFVLAALVGYILINGYWFAIIKNVAEGSSVPLPEWNDFGALFMKGLYGVIGTLILNIPVIILACLSAALTGGAQNITTGLDSNAQVSALNLLALCIRCFEYAVSFVIVIFSAAPLTRFALNGRLSTFWDLKGSWAFIRADIGNYVIAVLVSFVASFIGGLGIILCGIGLPFTFFWSFLVSAHLFGQYARGKASALLMSPSPLAPA